MRLAQIAATAVLIVANATGIARAGIENTLHDFTPTGPGAMKNPEPVGICVFCHTPHRAGQTTALWNRGLPDQSYDPYESSTLTVSPEQPTGSSRLCLSCHDGTVALGNVLNAPGETIAQIGTIAGPALLGTDLRDDHPVSFVFDEDLALQNGELVSPSALVGAVRLDREDRVQCTSCHDPHSEEFPKFLVTSVENGQLCITCHAMNGWEGSSHATSSASWNGVGENPWLGLAYPTVAQNACLSCHTSHSAASPERLIRRSPEEDVCLDCHNGNVASTNVAGDLSKPSHHPVIETSGIHDPPEDPATMDPHVSCPDCHNPHSVNASIAAAPNVSGRQQYVRGVDVSGAPIAQAHYAYEICFKCHGIAEAENPLVIRLDNETNVRLEIEPVNPSYHPVAAVGRNSNVRSLIPPLTETSRIYCHDCHNTDEASSPGPSTSLGPHGSTEAPILEAQYPLHDFVQQSASAYALCYKCHDEADLEGISAFDHKQHLQNGESPCVDCHDPHGSRINTHLINFLRFDENGAEVVQPSIQTGRLEYIDQGDGRGTCYLNCHGEEHCPKTYVGTNSGDIICP